MGKGLEVTFFSPKNACIKNLLRQISFLLNDFLNSTWELICCLWVTCYLDIFKPNLVLKLSNRPLLALNSPALDPSPFFCFKLSYNDFTFSQVILESMDMPFLQQSYTLIKAAFQLEMRYVFHKKCRDFMPAGIGEAMASQISFSFLYNYPYAGSLIMRW